MEEKVLKIEKLIYSGKGLAREGNYPIFAEDACPADEVKIEIFKRNKSYGLGKITEIITPSPHRIKPFCPMHNVCGGCGLQYVSYEEQLAQKQNIVKETVSKVLGKEIPVLPVKHADNDKNYRCKVQYPVSQTKVSKKILAGYFKKNSHETVNIKYCPVQPEILDRITEFIRQTATELKISGYDEKNHNGLLRHIIYRYSAFNGEILIVLVVNSQNIDKKLKPLAEKLTVFKEITGIAINFNTKKTNVITGEKTSLLLGKDFITEKIGDVKYKISATSFFQVNPYAAKIMFDTAKEMIEKNSETPSILDAYSGVSAFGLQMKDIAKEIICVEENTSSTNDALENVKMNNAKNVKVINSDASKTFEQFVKEQKTFDVVLLDPPRKGCSTDSIEYASKLSKKIIVYVSCNPASLARDLKHLEEKGFEAKYIQPVDMFCHTPHIESVVLLCKNVHKMIK